MDRNTPKPKGLRIEYASQFKDSSVVGAYGCRPAYPDATFPMLADLVVGRPRRVLDVGCGTGFVARPLVAYVDWVDAVDFSAPMLEMGRTLPSGDHPHLRWIHGAVEEVDLDPPYGLITAGASLHWMEWSIVMPRFRRLLTPGGFMVLVGMSALSRVPWWPTLLPLIQRYSTNRDFQPYDTVAELTARDLFSVSGRARTEPVPVSQTIADYIKSVHARNGLSRERMQPDAAAAFDAAATEILTAYALDGMLHWQNQGTLVWGKPDPNPWESTRLVLPDTL
jgi:ubiquinone/menaquinone biosynthesis C-methylase UbiE